MNTERIQLLDKLLKIYGPSGNEERICETIEREIRPYVDHIKKDALGNLIAFKKGTHHQKIMITAHMDEVGLIITHIDKNGFLKFSNVGGISPSISLGQRVEFKDGTIGIICSESLKEIKDLDITRLFIDIGASSKEEAEKKVTIGDVASFYGSLVINNNRAISKALDDRIGCFILIEALKQLKSTKNDIYLAFTSQEELGRRGAKTAAYGIHPDLGIAIDVTRTGDTPESKYMEVALGKGPAIKIMDNSIICHPKAKELLIKTAEENKIPYQREVLKSGGTDAGAIHLTHGGVPSGALSIPTRYIHSPGEMVDLEDVENSILLIRKSLERAL